MTKIPNFRQNGCLMNSVAAAWLSSAEPRELSQEKWSRAGLVAYKSWQLASRQAQLLAGSSELEPQVIAWLGIQKFLWWFLHSIVQSPDLDLCQPFTTYK